MATISAVHDISGVGRCSLNTAIAVLSAMGHYCCPFPTAVLSQQTGFPGYSYRDLTDEIPAFLEGWEHLGFVPDMIFTGFLGGDRQPGMFAEYIRRHPETIAVVDPVMADDGALYPCYTRSFAEEMGRLVRAAQIILPNITEFLLLCGLPPDSPTPPAERCLDLAQTLQAPFLHLVVITGVHDGPSSCNLLLDLEAKSILRVSAVHTGVNFSGTGDLFASIFCGAVARGDSPLKAVEAATLFVSTVAQSTPKTCDPRHGLPYERHLSLLTRRSLPSNSAFPNGG